MNKKIAVIAALFDKHRESLCCSEQDDLDDQEVFEEAMAPAICDAAGHMELVPDHCGMSKHDYCMRCGITREVLEP